MDDTISASDFTSAEASISSDPAGSGTAPVESSAPVDTTAQPEGATTPPAVETTDSPVSTDPAKPAGPIPFDVHKTALDNARTKAIAEYQQKYGWAEQVQQQDFQQAQRLASALYRADGDKIAALNTLIAELRKEDPNFETQIRSFAARTLGQRSSQPAAEQEPQPDLPIQLEDGRVVHLYSAEQQAKREAFLQQKWMQTVEQKLQPFQQTHEQLQAERQAVARQQQVDHFVTTTSRDVKSWPHMDNPAHLATFQQELAKLPDTNDPREVLLQAYRAHQAVMATVTASLQTTSRQAVLTDIHHQRNANTVNPAQQGVRAPKPMDEMSIAEALRHVAAQSA